MLIHCTLLSSHQLLSIMAEVPPKNTLNEDEELAFQLTLEQITISEEKRQIAAQDEIMATLQQYDQHRNSQLAAQRAALDEDVARKVQVEMEPNGFDLYTQYPGLDVVKGDSRAPAAIPSHLNRSVPAAAGGGGSASGRNRSDSFESKESDSESAYSSPAHSPRREPPKQSIFGRIGSALGVGGK